MHLFEIVRDAVPNGRHEVRQQTVAQLDPHQRTLYEILQDEGELDPGERYDAYTECVDDPKTKQTVRNYLTKMNHYRLVVADGKNRTRTDRPR